jgi:hypothetical protein
MRKEKHRLAEQTGGYKPNTTQERCGSNIKEQYTEERRHF